MKARIKLFEKNLKAKFPESLVDRAYVLFMMQAALLLLLGGTVVLVCFVDTGGRLNLYIGLLGGLLAVLIAALRLILLGKFKVSAFLTVLATVVGPWLSILLDSYVQNGDFVPLVFISLSIQLCAVLLSEKITIGIAAGQLTLLLVYINSNPNMMQINWPSLVVYVAFTAMLGIVASFMSRRQYERLERHRQKLKENAAELRTLADRDALTGLFNRRFMEEALERVIGIAGKNNWSIGIMMTDVDNYKQINDTYGHPVGDYVLRRIAEVILENIRSSDIACRYGGDEFMLILPNATLQIAQKRAEHLCKIIKRTPFVYEGKDIGTIEISFGVAAYPINGLNEDEVVKAADEALYLAKKRPGM